MANGNGLKIPLIIDSGLLVAGIIAATLLYADVSTLKAYADDVSASRVTRIEKDIEYIKKGQAETAADVKEMKEQLEASQKEILEALERLEGEEE